MTPLHLIRINENNRVPVLEPLEDQTVFQTNSWLRFLCATQNAEPVIAFIQDGRTTVGKFTGLIVKKYGLRILGSPFPGWTTSYMGFNLLPSVPRLEALLALESFAFQELRCVHFEIMDRRIRIEDVDQSRYPFTLYKGFEIDLTKSEDALFLAMDPACRRCIRKANKVGLRIEEANDESFVDDYYAQLQDVFAKQGLVPTYSKKRVEMLLEYLLSTGMLLLVRARNEEGTCIGTGVFPALNDTMYFWGGASYRTYQILRPNESIQWFAMRYWKARGIQKYDMGGSGEYKRKYGGYEIEVPWIRKSKYLPIEYLRRAARNLVELRQRIAGSRLAAITPGDHRQ